MEDWQQRVIDERNEVYERGLKLHNYHGSRSFVFSGMSDESKALLEVQHKIMSEYVEILDKRIALFKEEQ